jgi:hypothetical protein
VLTARTEVTDRMLIFGEQHLRRILARYESHYNGRRPHQRVRMSRIEDQFRTYGRVLKPHRTYAKLARIVRALCAVAGRYWRPLVAASRLGLDVIRT